MAVKNNKALDKLAESLTKKEGVIEHMTAQRDTLIENFIKAQGLLFSYWAHRHKNAMH